MKRDIGAMNSSPDRYFIPLLDQIPRLPSGSRALEMGYYDHEGVIWLGSRAYNVVALRPSVDSADDLRNAIELSGLRNAEIRTADELPDDDQGAFDIALVLAPFFFGNSAVRGAVAMAARSLTSIGCLYVQLHKRHGGVTHLRYASEFFAAVELIGIGGGQRRLYRASGALIEPAEQALEILGRTTLHEVDVRGFNLRIRIGAGVFSANGIDPGSLQLAEAVQIPAGARVLDLGCGAGMIGLAIAASDPKSSVVLVDSSVRAVELARVNVALNRFTNVDVRLGDGYKAVPSDMFDVIVSNVPAHRGHTVDLSTADQFITQAPNHLRTGGTAWFVANRNLPYERLASNTFRQVLLAASDRSYKVVRCTDFY